MELCPGVTCDEVVDCKNIKMEDGVTKLFVHPVDMAGAENGVDYKKYGKIVHADKFEVKLFRYLCLNAFCLGFKIHNDGDIRATGVRIRIKFPNDLLTISECELEEYLDPGLNSVPVYASQEEVDKCYSDWYLRFFSPNCDDEMNNKDNIGLSTANISSEENEDKFVSLDELAAIGDIANILDPSYSNGVVSIYPGEVIFDKNEVRHKGHDDISGLYVLPTKQGRFTIVCEIISNEFPDVFTQEIYVEVE